MKFKTKLSEKRWDPSIEEEILKIWEKNKIYRLNRKSKKPIFSIDTPPPYCSGPWHIGGAIHYSQIDMIARYVRMSGYEVRFPMATDRNGLPIEVQVEKAYNITMRDIPRDEFLKLCKEFLDKNEKEIIEIARRLGLSCNSFDHDEIVRTDDPEYRRITQATFIELWKRGLIYQAKRANNWCPVCYTTIADAEVEYREVETTLNYIRFEVEGGGEIVIATTRPELLCACKAVIVHPKDDRYKSLHGLKAIVPIYGNKVPIIAHKEAKMEFGTGAVMVCSYGDYTDVRLFRELNLKPVAAITPDGKMSEVAGKYSGQSVEDARKNIIEDLKSMGLLVKQERIMHRQPICWRSKNPIELIAMDEYYLDQLSFVEGIKKVIDEIKFHPPESKQILINWLNSITTDWPISRRRYYGTEIPIWYCKSCGKPVVPEPGPYYQPWKQDPPFKRCPHCGSDKGFVGEWRTFDTWMDSSITAIQYLYYMRDDEFFNRAFPCSLRPQGKDIIRTWLYYTLLRIYQLFKKPAFKHVWISGMVVDEKGEAMHKSKGNVVWPKSVIEKYGSDAIRLFGCLEASLGSDIRYSEERLSAAFRFLTKLWNVARFISRFPVVDKIEELSETDKWILNELNELVKSAKKGYDDFNFHIPAVYIRNFVWNIFAPHYIEMVKTRAYNTDGKFSEVEQKSAWYTLHKVLSTILKLLAPITPFITDKIYRELYSKEKSIHLEEFPKPSEEFEFGYKKYTKGIMKLNNLVWRYKKEKGLSLKENIKELWIPEILSGFLKDISATHHAKEVYIGEPDDKESYYEAEEDFIKVYIL
ncbi:MAG: valine--tRNA ligase [Candidatus Asgardarchaeia archaeon]